MSIFELREMIADLRIPQRVQTISTLNRLLELLDPFVTARVRIYSREHNAYWRVGGKGYTTDRDQAGVWSLYDAWFTTRYLGDEKRVVFDPVLPAAADHRPNNLEAVDRAARRFAELQGWDWDHMNDAHETPDGWSRNRCRDAVFQSVRFYREEESQP